MVSPNDHGTTMELETLVKSSLSIPWDITHTTNLRARGGGHSFEGRTELRVHGVGPTGRHTWLTFI